MRRLKLGIDLDGVVSDFSGWYITHANIRYNLSMDPSKQTTWAYTSLGLTEEQDTEIWADIAAIHNFWFNRLGRLPGTDLLYDKQYQHDFIFITSRTPTDGLPVWRQSAWWLSEALRIKYPQVIVVEPASQKVPIALALGLDAFCDDKPSTVRQFKNAGIPVWARLQPYNSADTDYPHVVDVNAFIEVVEKTLG